MPKKNFVKSEIYTIHNPHDDQEIDYEIKDTFQATVIDPGRVNCGIYVAKYYKDTGKQWTKYLANEEFIPSKCKNKNPYSESIRILDQLEENYSFFSKSNYIIIERQMTISTSNTRIGQHLISYFMTRYKNSGERPIIIEINSTTKTQMLGCPPKLKKPEYKKWCKEKAIELLNTNSMDLDNKNKFIDLMRYNKKDDDMGDVVCYFEVLKISLLQNKIK